MPMTEGDWSWRPRYIMNRGQTGAVPHGCDFRCGTYVDGPDLFWGTELLLVNEDDARAIAMLPRVVSILQDVLDEWDTAQRSDGRVILDADSIRDVLAQIWGE